MVATGGGGSGALATLPAVTRFPLGTRLQGRFLQGTLFQGRFLQGAFRRGAVLKGTFLAGLLVVAGCAGHDGREMVANGIGETPEALDAGSTATTTADPAGTSSLPEGTIPEGTGSDGETAGGGSAAGPGAVHGSVYVDSSSGTLGGSGTYDLSHPQLDGLAIGHPVNAALRRPAEAVRAEFVAALSERSGGEDGTATGDGAADGSSGDGTGPGDSLRGGGTVFLLDGRLVSVVYEMRIDWAGAADVDERVDSVLIDLTTGAELGLRDLFVAESPWLETIGFFVRRDLEARLGEGVLWEDGRGLEPEASNFDVFGVTATGLVVRFPMHQVAPGVVGTPEASVPWASLAGLVDPQGPAGHLAG